MGTLRRRAAQVGLTRPEVPQWLTCTGKYEEMKGRAKEAVGDLTDDDDMKRDGKTDQASGKVKQKVEDAKDAVERGIDKVTDKVKSKS